MKIALLGDIALFGCNKANNNYMYKFKDIEKYLSQFDFVIGNLETPLTNASKVIGGKSAYIKGSPEDVKILRYLHISHLSLANNHTFDFCEEGLKDTIKVLINNSIKWYGAYKHSENIECDDTHIRLYGYCCYSTNGRGLGKYINTLNPELIEKQVGDDSRKGFLPILSVHWGQEHVHYPNYDHVLMARKLAAKGNFIIHGHHPHVIQGLEKINNSMIAYSLGNFCFDNVYTKKSKQPLIRLSSDNRETMIIGLDIQNNVIANIEKKIFVFDEKGYTLLQDDSRIKQWSDFLDVNENDYRTKRDSELNAYLNQRKAKRNIDWYLKRLNLESVRMILSESKNHKMYHEYVQRYIGE